MLVSFRKRREIGGFSSYGNFQEQWVRRILARFLWRCLSGWCRCSPVLMSLYLIRFLVKVLPEKYARNWKEDSQDTKLEMTSYILVGKKVKVVTLLEWAEYMSNLDPYFRHVARTFFIVDSTEYCNLSTVFLGIDHALGESHPILFESMIFGGSKDEQMRRYYDWDEAEIGHGELTEQVDRLIRKRFDIQNIDTVIGERHERATEVYYTLQIHGHVVFNKGDFRLIREN
jgi:hypothetical protein